MSKLPIEPEGAIQKVDYLTALTSWNKIVQALLSFIPGPKDGKTLPNLSSHDLPSSQDLLNVYLFLEQKQRVSTELAPNNKD